MHRVEPYRYLVWLFTRLPLAATADDYTDLMPWRMPAAPPLLRGVVRRRIQFY
nr:transposase domain-containing protein [Burkholderia cenocepacia]